MLGDPDLVRAVLADFESAPLAPREKVLLRFLDTVIRCSWKVRRKDVDAVRAAGWSDEAVYDAVTVCALFKFYNTWCDATGVQPMPPEAHAESGKRIAARGYAW